MTCQKIYKKRETYCDGFIKNIFENVDINYSIRDEYEINVKNNIIATSKIKIEFYLDQMINNKEFDKDNIMIGRIKNTTAEKIEKDIGINLKNYSLAYNKSDIRHIYNGHIKNNKSQIPLSQNDLLLFPYILNTYDSIYLANNGHIVVDKLILDKYRIVVSFTKKKKNITLKSMYITKKREENSLPISHDSIESLPSSTSLTPPGAPSSSLINIIDNKNKNIN